MKTIAPGRRRAPSTGDAPSAKPPGAKTGTFASLSVPAYRTWFAGALVSNTGTWMGRVAQVWLVLTVVTDGSATALGIVTGLQFLPFLLFAPWAGLLADRFPKRRVLLVTQSGLAAASALIGVLAVTGTATLWMVYVIAFASGVLTAMDSPVRQAFASELVPRALLANAVSLNSASFNAGRLVGPAVAGLAIAAWGTGVTLLINAASFLFVVAAILLIRPSWITPSDRVRGGGIRDGLAYVAARRDLQLVLILVLVLGTFGLNFQLTVALMATDVFDKGVSQYGLLGSILAIGSLSAALYTARRAQPSLTLLVKALTGFVLASAAAALAPTYVVFAVLLAPVGFSILVAQTTANALLQTRVTPQMRGRVMALYMAVLMGGTPVGAPFIGWVGENVGARWTIGVGSVAVTLALAGCMVWLARVDDVHLRMTRKPHPRLYVTSPVDTGPEELLEPDPALTVVR